jgi:hypothetical protein
MFKRLIARLLKMADGRYVYFECVLIRQIIVKQENIVVDDSSDIGCHIEQKNTLCTSSITEYYCIEYGYQGPQVARQRLNDAICARWSHDWTYQLLAITQSQYEEAIDIE